VVVVAGGGSGGRRLGIASIASIVCGSDGGGENLKSKVNNASRGNEKVLKIILALRGIRKCLGILG